MFEDRTAERLKAEALAEIRASTGLSAMEGGFADHLMGPAAEMVGGFYQTLPAVTSMLFVDETSGGYIDKVGESYFALKRKAGTRARCGVALEGDPGTALAAGTAFLTAAGLEFRLAAAVTLGTEGTAEGVLEAADVGAAYNVEAGEITRMYVNPVGLRSFENGAGTGGTDPESDGALLARLDERRKRPATSGNGWHYRQWALEADGVGEAKVVELAEGPGTVGVTLLDAGLEPAPEEIVAAVREHIETQRPVGATPVVRGAEALEVTVSAQVALNGSTTAEAVRAEFASKLDAYRQDLIRGKYRRVYYRAEEDLPYTLIFNRAAALLVTVPGVENYTALSVNGGTADIVIPAGSVPVLGEVHITV